jgi:hypothetical protein
MSGIMPYDYTKTSIGSNPVSPYVGKPDFSMYSKLPSSIGSNPVSPYVGKPDFSMYIKLPSSIGSNPVSPYVGKPDFSMYSKLPSSIGSNPVSPYVGKPDFSMYSKLPSSIGSNPVSPRVGIVPRRVGGPDPENPCKICLDRIAPKFNNSITPIINDILTTRMGVDPIAMGEGELEKYNILSADYDNIAPRLIVKDAKMFISFLNLKVLPALKNIQKEQLCDSNNEVEYYGGGKRSTKRNSLKKRRPMMGGMTRWCRFCKEESIALGEGIVRKNIVTALNKCIEIINKILTEQQIPLLRSSKNEDIIKHIETYMAKAMKIIQERPPCEQESDYEMLNSGGGKRSTRKLVMKKRRKSLLRRRF